MKQTLLTALIFFLSGLSAFSQIEYYEAWGIDTCKFEEPCSWVQLDTTAQNIWQIGAPTKPFFNEAYSLPNAIVTDTLNPYPTSNHSYFDLVVPLENCLGIIISFNHKFQTDTLIDGGYIEVSDNQGETWTNVANGWDMGNLAYYATENIYSEQDTLKGGISSFSGTSSDWIYSRIEWVWCLPVEAASKTTEDVDTLMVRFHFISDDSQTNKAGWIIDNIDLLGIVLTASIQNAENSGIKMEILPNPIDDFAQIKFNGIINKMPLTLSFFDMLGQKVMQFDNITTQQIQFYKNNLAKGMYFAQLYHENTLIVTEKIIIK